LKRTISILLIITIISPLWFLYSIIQYEKYITKKEIKRFLVSKIDKNELVLLKFSIEETNTKLRWEHSKEFEYQGEMYDIVQKEIKSDSIYFWCWWDHEETKLNKQLESLVSQASGSHQQNRERSQRLNTFFNSLFINSFSYNNNFGNEFRSALFPRYIIDYSSRYLIPDTPPPKTIIS